MKQFLILLSFIFITTISFFFNNYLIWVSLLIISIILVSLIPYFKNILSRFKIIFISVFLSAVITFLMNFWLDNFDSAIIYTSRYLFMSILSLLFCSIFGLKNLSQALCFAIRPIKFLNIQSYENTVLIINIGTNLFPLIIQKFRLFNYSLKQKGVKLTPISIIKFHKEIVSMFMYWFFKVVDDFEKVLQIKGV